MRVDSACRLIDMLVYKPGWEIWAENYEKRHEGALLVHIKYPANNSSREGAPEGYPEKAKPFAHFVLLVGDIQTDRELYKRLAQVLLKIEEHEMREFLRIAPTYWAPFHPHQIDGIRSWHETPNMPEYFNNDLQFGIG